MGIGRNFKGLILKGLSGGRAGTRTPGLLRVKQSSYFQRLHRLRLISNIYNNLGNLLFAQKVTQVFPTDRVLTQF
jgi:hypothetical protein